MVRTLYLIVAFLIVAPTTLWAQIGISGTPNPSAVLDLSSPNNDKVFLPPRLTTVQRLAIASPPIGGLVYDLDKNTLYLYDGQNWLPLLTTVSTLVPPTSRTASDGAAGDNFGFSVAISGDYAIVGAYMKPIGSNSNPGQGAAYVFMRSGSGWTQQQRLTASDGVTSDSFGVSVAISGDYAVVGASVKPIGSNANQGAAYVFMRSGSGWAQQQRLTASDGAANDYFGYSVAISGDYAIMGAFDRTINFRKGAAYIFVQSGGIWTQQQQLMASDAENGDNFGYSVAISGDYAIVGARRKSINNNSNQGAAYVFMRSGTSWTQQQQLTASDAAANDYFGYRVAISGDYAIVGAFSKTVGGNPNQGAAYVFMRSGSGWAMPQRITDSSPANTFFGGSVGLSNGTYIIGGYGYQNAQGKVGFGTVN